MNATSTDKQRQWQQWKVSRSTIDIDWTLVSDMDPTVRVGKPWIWRRVKWCFSRRTRWTTVRVRSVESISLHQSQSYWIQLFKQPSHRIVNHKSHVGTQVKVYCERDTYRSRRYSEQQVPTSERGQFLQRSVSRNGKEVGRNKNRGRFLSFPRDRVHWRRGSSKSSRQVLQSTLVS